MPSRHAFAVSSRRRRLRSRQAPPSLIRRRSVVRFSALATIRSAKFPNSTVLRPLSTSASPMSAALTLHADAPERIFVASGWHQPSPLGVILRVCPVSDDPDAFWNLLDERASWFYEAVGAGAAMAPKRPGPSSAYLSAYKDKARGWTCARTRTVRLTSIADRRQAEEVVITFRPIHDTNRTPRRFGLGVHFSGRQENKAKSRIETLKVACWESPLNRRPVVVAVRVAVRHRVY